MRNLFSRDRTAIKKEYYIKREGERNGEENGEEEEDEGWRRKRVREE